MKSDQSYSIQWYFYISYWSIQWYFSIFECRWIDHIIIINDFQSLYKFIYSQTNLRSLESTFYWLYCIKFVFPGDCVEKCLWYFQKSINQSRKIRNFFFHLSSNESNNIQVSISTQNWTKILYRKSKVWPVFQLVF